MLNLVDKGKRKKPQEEIKHEIREEQKRRKQNFQCNSQTLQSLTQRI